MHQTEAAEGQKPGSGTVAPRYNEPRYNEDPVITNNIWKPGRMHNQFQ